MVGKNCKDLLKLEANANSISTNSTLESKFLLCKKSLAFSSSAASLNKPAMFPVPKSQVLGKLKDFLGVISESNKKLQQDAKVNPDNYDIEVLSNAANSEYIEMDLMLGVADLHTPEAVAAAEAAIAGYSPATVPFSSESDDEERCEESEIETENDKLEEQHSQSTSKSVGKRTSNEVASCKELKNNGKRKLPKIVELS